ncbi:MAG: PrsW family intramembrane metalloprotease [Candidatus Dormibacteraeota bacterium]|uniref:PrsW family intramembrane metalloprotease n=1 Tax=Candidatus Amunia macphersoniae TaxID=3127014 RepID=A0A934KPD4_9BACT|nr:PrsW family intramembrane metalloprotease [Candidatus Dormibacteraeota bacterium]
MRCAHCRAEVPDGEFCTRCGAHRSEGRDRLRHFALRPGEHIATPGVLSTLLPRLAHGRVHLFRWALIAGVAAVAILAATGLVVPAIWVAALVVPALYLTYLREAEVFGREPLLVLLATVVAGGLLGLALTAAANQLGDNLGGGGVIALTVGVAVLAELLKPVVPLLALRRRFPHTLEGLVLGVAAGTGYALAQTLLNLLGTSGGAPLRVDPSSWVFTLFSAALLIPLLHGSCTGLVTASLWRPRGGREAGLRAAGLPLALVADIGFTVGSELLDDAGLSPLFVLLWQAVVVSAVLIAIRLVVHAATLDEAAELGVREVVCPHCGRRVEAAGFCPHCGVSIAASVAKEPALSR